ncbi:hypothetical protein BGZ51_002984 [Haplosporangium sp. Z 767]|nr:hypothetical protein BGZ51_002984 [Haplosporangium sp. Z 767]KAF9188640.1 hypothetical protein BGZ50_001219 [Haplosporangium sp. Z 11]
MKCLLRLSLATLLAAATTAGGASISLEEFLRDPQVLAVAPHLVQKIATDGVETASSSTVGPNAAKMSLLNDIIEIITLTVVNPNKDVDWSRLEAAKLQAIQLHGEEALYASANLTAIDTQRAALIVNMIYDIVIHLPATDKSSHEAKLKSDPSSEKMSWSLWKGLGLGLIKTSDIVQTVKSIVTSGGVCETTDASYLEGVAETVYYSALTDGLAGSTLASAPSDSAVKSLSLGTIIVSAGKLAIELHMAQTIARLADLDPKEDSVRTMIYLSLVSENSRAEPAQAAREILYMQTKGMVNKIPAPALRSIVEKAALVLITRGSGFPVGPKLFANIPVVRNVFAFGSDVLSAHRVGDVLKYVFCPEMTTTSAEKGATEMGKKSEKELSESESENATEKKEEQKTTAVTENAKDEDDKVEIDDDDGNGDDEVEMDEGMDNEAGSNRDSGGQKVLKVDPEAAKKAAEQKKHEL